MTTLAAFLGLLVCGLLLFLPEDVKAEAAATGDYVVLLHGYGRTAVSMKRMQWYLQKEGYRVINATYPSSRMTVENLSEVYLRELLEKQIVDPTAKVHFVTHSLGGIIVREYCAHHELTNLGRVVMLAPPNGGSEIVDFMKRSRLGRIFNGPSRLQLGTGPEDLPKQLGPVHFELGVIAGDRSLNPLLSALLPGPSDGKVTVASARVDGMEDFLVVHYSHTWLMWRGPILRQTLRFLRTGNFEHEVVYGTKALSAATHS